MSRIIIDVGLERKKKMNLLIKGKNAKFKTYNELIRRLLDDYLASIQLDQSQELELGSLMNQIPQSKGKIIIRLGEKGASAYFNDKILVEKEQLKDLIFFLWENYRGYKLEFIGIKPQDYIFATFSGIKCWDMFSIEDHSFPVVPIAIQNHQKMVRIFALLDTASSIVILDNSLKDLFVTEKIGEKRVITPVGERLFEIHLMEYNLNDISVKCESIFADLPATFKKLDIQAIIGENLLKNKNILVLYLRNVTCISD